MALEATSTRSETNSASLALLAIRLASGVIFMFHGGQKLFGLFGGKGLAMTIQFMGPVNGTLVSVGEFFGGLAVLLGLFSRFSAASHMLIMAGAIVMVHGKHGFASADNGFEYNYALFMMALAVFVGGPGRFALARLLPAKLKPWLE